MTQTDHKITLVNIKFSMQACKKLTSQEIENLSQYGKTARGFFLLYAGF